MGALTVAMAGGVHDARAAPAADADDAAARSPRLLTTVVVVATTPLPGSEIDRATVAAPAQTATAEELARTHALDLSAFMNRTLGSVYVNEVQNNPLQPDVNYRGYTASPLLGTPQGLSVYLDGMRLNQPFGDVVSWDLIPREAIAALTLMPGSNPAFGLNTLGGALALTTKDGVRDAGFALGAEVGSARRRRYVLEAGGHADSGLYAYATANTLADDGWRDASPTDATQAFGKLGWRDAATDVALTGAWAHTDLNGNGLQEQRLLANDYRSVYTRPDTTRNRAWLVNLTGARALADGVRLSANAYYRRIATRTLNGDVNDAVLGGSPYQPTAAELAVLAAAGYTGVPPSGETQANTPFPSWRCIVNALSNDAPNEQCNALLNRTSTRQREAGASLQASFMSRPGGRENRLTIGAAWLASRAQFAQSAQFGYLDPERAVVGVEGPGAFADGTQASADALDARVDLIGRTRTRSLYFTDTWRVVPVVHLTLSGRYDRSEVDDADALTPGGGPGSLDGRHRFQRFNPAFGIAYAPSAAFGAYLGWGEGSRAPSAIELGCADSANPCKLPNAMAGDPPLQQVVTRTLELGMRGVAPGGLAWNAGVFRADNRRDILFVADDSAGFGYFRNFGRTRRQGVELGVSGTRGAFGAGANYTFLDARFRSPEIVPGAGNSSNDAGAGFDGAIAVQPGDRIPLVPRHLFKSWVSWRVLPRLSATADLIAVAGSTARGNENGAHRPDGEFYLGPGRTAGYAVANLGLEFEPAPGLTLHAQVNNLFDRRYATAAQLGATAFDGAGRFVARPFAAPVVDGERPLLGSTFVAPGAPRGAWVGVRYAFGAAD